MKGEHFVDQESKSVSIDAIVRNPKLMPRLRREESRVALFVELIQAGIDVGPININQNYELLDGDHRLAAYEILKVKTILAIVINTANEHEAFRIAANLNAKHGLPYTNKDRQQQAIILYTTWPGKDKPTDNDIIELSRGIGCSRAQFWRYISGHINPRGKKEEYENKYDLNKSTKENAKALGVSTSYAHKIKTAKTSKISHSHMREGNLQQNEGETEATVIKSIEVDTAPQTRQQADETLTAVKIAAETPHTTLNESVQSLRELANDVLGDTVAEIEKTGLSSEAREEQLGKICAWAKQVSELITPEIVDMIVVLSQVLKGDARRTLMIALKPVLDPMAALREKIVTDNVDRVLRMQSSLNHSTSTPPLA